MLNTIALSTRETTLYSVDTFTGDTYETFDYDKATQMVTYSANLLVAAECVDCKALIPVLLVDKPESEGNICPQSISRPYSRGHRVPSEDYTLYEKVRDGEH